MKKKYSGYLKRKDGVALTQILIPVQLKDKLKEYADLNGIKLSFMAEKVIEGFLKDKNFLACNVARQHIFNYYSRKN